MTIPRALLVLGLSASFFALPAAQDQATREPFRTEVNYVRVDLYPMRDGAPVADLVQSEVEVLDNGVPQKIDRFEHVLIQGSRSQETRREPTTVAEMREAARDIRARLFIVFLDTNHVEAGSGLNVRRSLSNALNSLIGGDDLIAVVTPGMSARDITFTRRTRGLEELLQQRWGERDRPVWKDPVEEQYATCYPANATLRQQSPSDQGIAQEMILRRRESQTLETLEEMVRHLRGVREERKAVIMVSAGWRLFRENASLRRGLTNETPPTTPIGLDPRTGRLGTNDLPYMGVATPACERDRLALSMLDDERDFHRILDEANRANTSFYPLDPRGLVVFDENIVPVAGVGTGAGANPMVSLPEDSARLNARVTSLRTLAENTDGVAIVQTSEIAAGLRRMVEDLSSYYLIGYYSSEKLDGRFHRLTVRVKRPGVQVRARRGYLASTPEAASAAASASAAKAVSTAGAAEAQAMELPLAALSVLGRERPVRMQVAAGHTPAGLAAMWVVAEAPARAGTNDWAEGGQADITLLDSAGATVASEHVAIKPGTSSVRVTLGSNASLVSGDYQVQIRAKGTAASLSATEIIRVSLPPTGGTGALFSRRGITTGNREVPTADVRFRRTERLLLEIPTQAAESPSARLLDRTGKAMAIPVTAAVRDDGDGSRWLTAQLALAPLAPGDYLIELTAGGERTLTAFRVLP